MEQTNAFNPREEESTLSLTQEMKGSVLAMLKAQQSGLHPAYVVREMLRFQDLQDRSTPNEMRDVVEFVYRLRDASLEAAP